MNHWSIPSVHNRHVVLGLYILHQLQQIKLAVLNGNECDTPSLCVCPARGAVNVVCEVV